MDNMPRWQIGLVCLARLSLAPGTGPARGRAEPLASDRDELLIEQRTCDEHRDRAPQADQATLPDREQWPSAGARPAAAAGGLRRRETKKDADDAGDGVEQDRPGLVHAMNIGSRSCVRVRVCGSS
jgi:hypothetical protein